MFAAQLSRVLVSCYPSRWRRRYRDEVLEVLDQHRASGRTVLNLGLGALSTHLDPSYRLEGLQMARLRHHLRLPAVVFLTFAVPIAAFMAVGAWEESRPVVPVGGSDSMAFASGRPT